MFQMQTHTLIVAIIGLCLFGGLIYWIVQIKRDMNGQLENQHARLQNVEQAVQYFQRQHVIQQQMFQAMSQPPVSQPPSRSQHQQPIRKVKPVPPPRPKKPVVPPPTPEEVESPDELDELLKEELAELNEIQEEEKDEDVFEELSTDSLKKTTNK